MASAHAESPRNSTPTSILSLPDEILLEIFTAVKAHSPGNNPFHQDPPSSSPDIAALRLVSRRFNSISAPLVVHYIRLSGINAHSLEKLEFISQHPLLAKGLRTVRVEACGYVPTLADDVAKFAKWAGGRVLARTGAYARIFVKEMESEQRKKVYDKGELWRKHAEVTEVRKRVKAVLNTWNTIICPEENQHTSTTTETGKRTKRGKKHPLTKLQSPLKSAPIA